MRSLPTESTDRHARASRERVGEVPGTREREEGGDVTICESRLRASGKITMTLLLLVLWPTPGLSFGESFEIDEQASERVAAFVMPRLARLGATEDSLRVKRSGSHVLVRSESKKTCVGDYCITLVLSEDTGEMLTSALLPKGFFVSPHQPAFFPNSRTLKFKSSTFLILGDGFAAVLALEGYR